MLGAVQANIHLHPHWWVLQCSSAGEVSSATALTMEYVTALKPHAKDFLSLFDSTVMQEVSLMLHRSGREPAYGFPTPESKQQPLFALFPIK